MATRTTLLLIRHGETAWNRERIFRGTADVPLSDRGRRQARALAAALRDHRLHAGYTSPLSRARETAEVVLAPHGLVAAVHAGLLDFDYGAWTGKTEAEVAAQWPEPYQAWLRAPHSVRVPGGNTLAEVQARAATAMEEIARRHAGETVALFAHRVINKLLVLAALGLPPDRFPQIIQGHCGLNVLQYEDGRYFIERINDTAHLRSCGAEALAADF